MSRAFIVANSGRVIEAVPGRVIDVGASPEEHNYEWKFKRTMIQGWHWDYSISTHKSLIVPQERVLIHI